MPALGFPRADQSNHFCRRSDVPTECGVSPYSISELPDVCKEAVDSLFLSAMPLNKLDDAVFGPVDVFALT